MSKSSKVKLTGLACIHIIVLSYLSFSSVDESLPEVFERFLARIYEHPSSIIPLFFWLSIPCIPVISSAFASYRSNKPLIITTVFMALALFASYLFNLPESLNAYGMTGFGMIVLFCVWAGEGWLIRKRKRQAFEASIKAKYPTK